MNNIQICNFVCMWKLKFESTLSLLICTLRSDIEGDEKVVLQNLIFSNQKKNLNLQNHFFATLKITSKNAD